MGAKIRQYKSIALILAAAYLLVACQLVATPDTAEVPATETSATEIGEQPLPAGSPTTIAAKRPPRPRPATKSYSPRAKTPTPDDVDTVRLGMSGGVSDAGLIIAMERNYFEQEGLRVEVTPFLTAAEMLPQFRQGRLDVGTGILGAGLFSAAQGSNLKIVADKGSFVRNHGSTVLMVRQDLIESGAIRSLQDFKGRKVAVSNLWTAPHYAFLKAYEDAGGSSGDVEMQEMSMADIATALKEKAIDAGMVGEPNAVRMEREGLAVRWKRADELVLNSENAVLLYSNAWSAGDPDAAQSFMVAYLEGVRDYVDAFEKNRSKAEIVRILIKHTTFKEVTVYEKMVAPNVNPNGWVDVAEVARQQQWYVDKEQVKTPVPINQIVDDQYAEYAVQRLGEYK